MRILLVDDNRGFLDILRHFLSASPRYEIVGTATCGLDGLEKVKKLRPDLVLTDFSMPEMDGAELTRRLKLAADPPIIIMLTMFEGDQYREHAAAAHADAFVPKYRIEEELLPLLESLSAALAPDPVSRK